MMHKEDSAKILLAGVVGFAVGILFAPRSGDETRARLRAQSEEAKARMRMAAADVKQHAREVAADVRRSGKDIKEDLKPPQTDSPDEII